MKPQQGDIDDGAALTCLSVNEIRRMRAARGRRPTRQSDTCADPSGATATTRPLPASATTSGDANEITNCNCPTRSVGRQLRTAVPAPIQ
jgi:hypothetical protein